MSLQLSIALLVLLVGSRAMADRVVEVDMVNGQRFDVAQLTTALRARIAPVGPPISLALISIGDGDEVVIEIHGVRRTLALGSRTGEDAARLVALVASDLLLDDLSTAPPLTPRAVWTIDVVGEVAAWDHPLVGGLFDLTIPHGAWLVMASLGGGAVVNGTLHVDAEIVRLGVGRRFGWLDLGVHASIVPVEATNGAGDVTVLVGGGVTARARLPIATGVAVVLAAGIDAFATRTQYDVAGANAGSTPWIAPWLAAGLEVAP